MAKEAKATKVVNLFYDGDKYKDPVFVCINGKSWAVKRGEDIEVPVEVAEVLENAEKQNNAAAMVEKKMSEENKVIDM